MAQYKVLQDIEAEDKLLGPLSLRQFIYAIIVIALGFVAFQLARVQWLLALPFLPPITFFGLLAAPFGRDQSSEIWLLAKIKYWVFPRRRLWDQTGISNPVTITAPKVVEKHYTKDFDKEEAKSRLKALATTMDTRGWAIKNLSSNGYRNPLQQGSSDRLLELQETPQEDLAAVRPDQDILDPVGTPLAQTFSTMQNQSEQAHRQAILQKMHSIADQQKASQAHMARIPAPQPQTPATPAQQQQQTPPAPAAAQPAAPQTPTPPVPTPQTNTTKTQAQPMTQAQSPAILKEVRSPESPSVLRPSDAQKNGDEPSEVVVSLH